MCSVGLVCDLDFTACDRSLRMAVRLIATAESLPVGCWIGRRSTPLYFGKPTRGSLKPGTLRCSGMPTSPAMVCARVELTISCTGGWARSLPRPRMRARSQWLATTLANSRAITRAAERTLAVACGAACGAAYVVRA